jgi:hypothetical protein
MAQTPPFLSSLLFNLKPNHFKQKSQAWFLSLRGLHPLEPLIAQRFFKTLSLAAALGFRPW